MTAKHISCALLIVISVIICAVAGQDDGGSFEQQAWRSCGEEQCSPDRKCMIIVRPCKPKTLSVLIDPTEGLSGSSCVPRAKFRCKDSIDLTPCPRFFCLRGVSCSTSPEKLRRKYKSCYRGSLLQEDLQLQCICPCQPPTPGDRFGGSSSRSRCPARGNAIRRAPMFGPGFDSELPIRPPGWEQDLSLRRTGEGELQTRGFREETDFPIGPTGGIPNFPFRRPPGLGPAFGPGHPTMTDLNFASKLGGLNTPFERFSTLTRGGVGAFGIGEGGLRESDFSGGRGIGKEGMRESDFIGGRGFGEGGGAEFIGGGRVRALESIGGGKVRVVEGGFGGGPIGGIGGGPMGGFDGGPGGDPPIGGPVGGFGGGFEGGIGGGFGGGPIGGFGGGPVGSPDSKIDGGNVRLVNGGFDGDPGASSSKNKVKVKVEISQENTIDPQ